MSKYLHKVHVNLYKNPLTSAADDYSGRTKVEHVYNIDDVSQLAFERGGSGMRPEDMARAVKAFLKEMAYQLCDDNAINLGYFHSRLCVQGIFTSPADTFDPARHKLLFELRQGKLLRDELERVEVAVNGVADTLPFISTVYDYGSDTANELLTPGNSIDLRGHHLRFLPGWETNGIFLLPAAGGDACRLSQVMVNKPKHLVAMLPAHLPSGDYRMEVRTNYATTNKPLKAIKTGRFDALLTVPEP
ncbi:MAG: DUF4469 domain-containing protein [Prevotellaceae bacterium]|jgi:hypothetical protein|nr:DUF4469 domain-containing protein [Prevotellaceae bacterium]